jgi:hypothetical protein
MTKIGKGLLDNNIIHINDFNIPSKEKALKLLKELPEIFLNKTLYISEPYQNKVFISTSYGYSNQIISFNFENESFADIDVPEGNYTDPFFYDGKIYYYIKDYDSDDNDKLLEINLSTDTPNIIDLGFNSEYGAMYTLDNNKMYIGFIINNWNDNI